MRLGHKKTTNLRSKAFFMASFLMLQLAFPQRLNAYPKDAGKSSSSNTTTKNINTTAKTECPAAPKEGPDTSSVVSRVVFKHGPTFMVATADGMLDQFASTACGIYSNDTRYVSRLEWFVDGKKPALLSSFTDLGYQGQFVYGIKAKKEDPDNIVSITRDIAIAPDTLNPGVCLNDRLKITNYGSVERKLSIGLSVDSDFRDMFEVRGMKRDKRGTVNAVKRDTSRSVHLSYTAVNGKTFNTCIGFNRDPSHAIGGQSRFDLTISPGKTETIDISIVSCGNAGSPALNAGAKETFPTYEETAKKAGQAYSNWRKTTASIETDNSVFNKMIEQCFRDIYVLRQTSAGRRCIAAGIPWYAVPFGRDQAVTALQILPLAPDLARDALKFLAAYQGREPNATTEEAPGKIMHELRLGEMALCKEIPFTPYYGTVDATPLWLVLLGRYVDVTKDLKLAQELWPSAQAALKYIKREIDHPDSRGFLTYGRGCTGALSNQGWKDSGDSIVHADGTLAKHPIALCEVQGYVYEALITMANLQRQLNTGRSETETNKSGINTDNTWNTPEDLEKAAVELKTRFDKAFWLTDKNFIALAIDGDNRPCSVISSNPGHLLDTNIVTVEQAKSISKRLMQDDMYSGWGIRTLSSKERAFNPMGYHTGSVWPHDNGITAQGMGKQGFREYSRDILTGLFESAQATGTARLPELFCGFPRKEYAAPIAYPVSCSPQSWAAGSLLQSLLSSLGIDADSDANQLEIAADPLLPSFVKTVRVRNLMIAGKRLGIEFKFVRGVVSVSRLDATEK